MGRYPPLGAVLNSMVWTVKAPIKPSRELCCIGCPVIATVLFPSGNSDLKIVANDFIGVTFGSVSWHFSMLDSEFR